VTTYAFSYRPAACFRVGGEDAGSYLQGQFSNDLRQATGNAVYGLFLNGKGKVVADAQVLKLTEQAYLVTSYFSPAAVVRRRLEEFIVADDVVLEDLTPMTRGLAVWGAECGRMLRQRFQVVPSTGQFVQSDDLVVCPGRRTKGENFEIIGPDHLIGPVREQLLKAGCVEAEANQAECLRLTQGIPAIPQDIGPGDLPNEGNLDQEAISYTKGCYLGQEVMARLKTMGQVRRRLQRVRGSGERPPRPAALFQATRRVGELRSSARDGANWIGLAMISLGALRRDEGLALTADGAPNVLLAETS